MSTYYVRTFGCQMNKHDSERIAGMLDAAGMTPAADIEAADVIVFNTCAVRAGAEERLRGQVSSLKAVKDVRPDVLLAVGGCVAQKDAEALAKALPHVDVIFGTHNLEELPALLTQAAETRRPQVHVVDGTDTFATDLPSRRDRPWSAWLPITVGCDNHCTYCIVPTVRGPERSRPLEDIVAEATRLVADGVVEITLLGQNVNSYGRDRYGEPRFAELLTKVAGESGVPWLRFTTSHPKDLSDATIAAMAATPQVCRYLHLPAQSGSDRILAAMNRRYTAEHYLGLLDKVRRAMPDLALSGDIIVGFPGETEEDFTETVRFVRSLPLTHLHVFPYSRRPGTAAAALPGQVPPADRERRAAALRELGRLMSHAFRERHVGATVRALVQGQPGRARGATHGLTGNYLSILVPAAAAQVGTFREIRITRHEGGALHGEFCD